MRELALIVVTALASLSEASAQFGLVQIVRGQMVVFFFSWNKIDVALCLVLMVQSTAAAVAIVAAVITSRSPRNERRY